MQGELTVTATEFKAKCLDILDQLASRKLTKVTITKRGKPTGVLLPPVDSAAIGDRPLYGYLKGLMVIPDDLDLTAPAFDEPFDANEGILPR